MRDVMDAVLALLRAIDPTQEELPVLLPEQLDVDVTRRPTLYVVVWDQTPIRRGASLDGRGHARGITFSTQYVGTSTGEVRDTADDVSAALLGVRLTVDGRVSTPLKSLSGSPVLADNETRTPRLYSATDVWRCAFSR